MVVALTFALQLFGAGAHEIAGEENHVTAVPWLRLTALHTWDSFLWEKLCFAYLYGGDTWQARASIYYDSCILRIHLWYLWILHSGKYYTSDNRHMIFKEKYRKPNLPHATLSASFCQVRLMDVTMACQSSGSLIEIQIPKLRVLPALRQSRGFNIKCYQKIFLTRTYKADVRANSNRMIWSDPAMKTLQNAVFYRKSNVSRYFSAPHLLQT